MTATNHAITGAVIAIAVKKPELAIPIAFLSHFVIDAIPHFDTENDIRLAKKFIPADLLIAGLAIIILTSFVKLDIPRWLVFASMAVATSPDIVWGWRYYKLRDLKKIVEKPMSRLTYYHQKIQWSESRKGIVIEVIWLGLMCYLIKVL
jgi:hypothetical protein